MRRGEGLADQDAGRQRVGDRAQESGIRGESCAYAAVDRHGGGPPGTGGHRKRAHRQLGTLRAERAGAAGTGRENCAGRFWNGLLVARPAAAARCRPHQDRPPFRPGLRRLRRRRGDRPGHRGPRSRKRPADHRRRRGDAGAKRISHGRSAATSFRDFSCRARFRTRACPPAWRWPQPSRAFRLPRSRGRPPPALCPTHRHEPAPPVARRSRTLASS